VAECLVGVVAYELFFPCSMGEEVWGIGRSPGGM
jgi:hypothetical protein